LTIQRIQIQNICFSVSGNQIESSGDANHLLIKINAENLQHSSVASLESKSNIFPSSCKEKLLLDFFSWHDKIFFEKEVIEMPKYGGVIMKKLSLGFPAVLFFFVTIFAYADLIAHWPSHGGKFIGKVRRNMGKD